MSKVTVSILMACFNAERWIGATLRSILQQTYTDFEVVVVDDGSSDQSGKIVDEFQDPRIRLIREPSNQGASAARNIAFAASKGEFVLFVDADDLIAPKHIESLLSRLRNEPNCVALSQWTRFRCEPIEAIIPSRPTERDLDGVDWLALDWESGEPMTQSGMLLIPHTLIEQHGGWDTRLSLIDDFEFFARIISRSGGVRFAPEACLFYRSGISGSLSNQRSRAAIVSQLNSLVMGTDHLLAVRDDRALRSICAGLLQAFDYEHYPEHPDLRAQARARAKELGGSTIEPAGPPGFQALRKFIGWKLARRVQLFAESYRIRGKARL